MDMLRFFKAWRGYKSFYHQAETQHYRLYKFKYNKNERTNSELIKLIARTQKLRNVAM